LAQHLTPHEVAFFAPALNASLMRGLLRYNPATSELEVMGYLQWGSWGMFGILALQGLPFAVGLAALGTIAYFGERRRFRNVLYDVRGHCV
jgi:hypothetical protein